MLRSGDPGGGRAALLGVLASGYGTVPALGPALDPGRGVWTSASGGELPHSQALSLPGLAHPVQVSFTSHGVPSVQAADDHDLFLALGYLHARFRLAEMDLERRLGEGRLAQLAGPSALGSDKFELRLGLLRTAQREWAQMPRSSPAAQALLAYSRGVNDYLAQLRRDGQWPALFSLAGVYPAGWTPVDSLVIQGDLTQELDFTTTPLDYALLERALGAGADHGLVPGPAAEPAAPLRPRPLPKAGPRPAPPGRGQSSAARTPPAGHPPRPPPPGGPPRPSAGLPGPRGRGEGRGCAARPAEPACRAVHGYPDSNAWAANGPEVRAAGPCWPATRTCRRPSRRSGTRSRWHAPGWPVSGVSVPGLPGILLGHNQHIAWSLTDTQNQAALFYTEKTSKARPGQYFWDGAWRRMRQVQYTIASAAARRCRSPWTSPCTARS